MTCERKAMGRDEAKTLCAKMKGEGIAKGDLVAFDCWKCGDWHIGDRAFIGFKIDRKGKAVGAKYREWYRKPVAKMKKAKETPAKPTTALKSPLIAKKSGSSISDSPIYSDEVRVILARGQLV